MKTLSGDHLFKAEKLRNNISEKKNTLLHRLVAKILSLKKLARLDIQTIVAFLILRVQIPDRYDRKNCEEYSATFMGK